ncbi:MAG: right-handed parallel beta-helix repeat-containing protein [Candidatus Hydrogenedentes bacterium]|nr:right-handed parallel beta-helix repeat-containing protein [Candidatus Hydrogenedentota bacterium]
MRSFNNVLCVVMALSLLTLNAAADFYVATDGSDQNPGTEAAPFATLTRAQQAVREAGTHGLDRDLNVLLRSGTYRLDSPLRFEPEDAGTAEHRVTYKAFSGESVEISGGKLITDWKAETNNQWTVTLPEVTDGNWCFRQLFVDGHRLQRGRFPNAPGILRVKTVSEDYRNIILSKSPGADNLSGINAELVMYQNWSISRAGIASSDGTRIILETPMGWVGHGSATSASVDKPTYVENALSFVDTPGEWYLDESSGTLTYQAADGEDPNTRCFVAPAANALIQIAGTQDKPVRNLHFDRINFAHTRWERPTFGYSGIQAGHYGTNMSEPTHVLPLAISFLYTEACSIKNAHIEHTGACAIGFGAGTQDNTVESCSLVDIGANGIMVGWRGIGEMSDNVSDEDRFLSADWPQPQDVPESNTITGNLIQRCGAINHGCVGIFDAFSRGTAITHNVVRDMPYSGISVGFRWNESRTSQQDTLIAFNHVYNTMKVLADGGCLYTLGFQPGTIIRGNIFHDAHRSVFAHGGAPNNGIFFDQGSKGYLVEDNTIYNTSGNPIRFNQTNADNLTFKNNHFGIGVDTTTQ